MFGVIIAVVDRYNYYDPLEFFSRITRTSLCTQVNILSGCSVTADFRGLLPLGKFAVGDKREGKLTDPQGESMWPHAVGKIKQLWRA